MSKSSRRRRRQERRKRAGKRLPPCSVCGCLPKWKLRESPKAEWVFYCRNHKPVVDTCSYAKKRCWKHVRWSQSNQKGEKRFWCEKHCPKPKWKVELDAKWDLETEADLLKMYSEEMSRDVDKMVIDSLVNVQPMSGPIDGVVFYKPRFDTGYNESNTKG